MPVPSEPVPESDAPAPAAGTAERWAFDYVATRDLRHKIAPPPRPDRSEPARALRITQPGRPPELDVRAKTPRSVRPGGLREPRKRAALLHTFWHHELQAAELMCMATLAFPDTPAEFRRGLLGIADDEIRHMAMYRRLLEDLGHGLGDFPVRDWFWERVPQCRTPIQFVALLGLGLEGGNLDHSERFITAFEDAGDRRAAATQATVCREEIAHVSFARHWFEQWTGTPADFDRWRAELVEPLTPKMLHGKPLNRADRLAAGLTPEFVDALAAWQPEP